MIENVKITDVSLTMADHGCLTYWLYVAGAGWECGIGGYMIGRGYLGADNFDGFNGDGIESMMRIMDTVGVERWEDLKGKYMRVETDGWGSGIHTIGNLISNKWFNINGFFEGRQEEMEAQN